MSRHAIENDHVAQRRSRAVVRLSEGTAPRTTRAQAASALGVLHELASSPVTAAQALALLHELQVHQVELDMQDEELRNSRAELEAALARQIQLYDFAPVGCCTVDRQSVLTELNLTAARLLGADRGALLGQALGGFLAPASADALRTLMTRAVGGSPGPGCRLELKPADGARRTVLASAGPDPAGRGCLLSLIETDAAPR
jgi:PAS domain-containing protein